MFAVLHIADFALQAVLRTEPNLARLPAALFQNTSRKSIVLTANSAARACRVELGMTAPQAVARCPNLVIRTPHASAEAEARAALLAVGFTLSPAIEDTAPGTCTADLKGGIVRPESVAAIAITQLEQLGLSATGGIGRTPLLAWYAAKAAGAQRARASSPLRLCSPIERSHTNSREGQSEPSETSEIKTGHAGAKPVRRRGISPRSIHSTANDTKFGGRAEPRIIGEPSVPVQPLLPALEQVADEPAHYFCSADGVLVIHDEKAFLAPLPLAAADPLPELANVFTTWGLRTFGDLTALPRDEIVRRFGSAGLALWNRASGGDYRPLHLVVPPQTFSAAMQFEQEVESLQPLLFIVRRFVDRLTLELRAAQHVAAEVELTLRLEDAKCHTRSFRLPEPTADAEILFRALYTHLESLQTDASIAAVELRLTPTRPLVRQQGLFDTGLRDPHGFAETLARVAALVGSDRVGTPQPEDTHRPDVVKLVPPPEVVPPPLPTPPLHPAYGLPLRRFRPPLPATLEFGPTERKPTYVATAQFEGNIREVRGPWRNDGEWWQVDRAWHRLEWDIALAEGGLYRLLRIGDAYFIEGEYD